MIEYHEVSKMNKYKRLQNEINILNRKLELLSKNMEITKRLMSGNIPDYCIYDPEQTCEYAILIKQHEGFKLSAILNDGSQLWIKENSNDKKD